MSGTDFMEILALEVDASDVANLVANHSGQSGGATGWSATAPVAVSSVTSPSGVPAGALYATKAIKAAGWSGVGGQLLRAPSAAVSAGQYVGAQLTMARATRGPLQDDDISAYAQLGVEFYSSGAVLLATSWSATMHEIPDDTAHLNVAKLNAQQAPTNTATARVVVRMGYSNTGTTDPANTFGWAYTGDVYGSRLMFVKATTAALVQSVAFTDTTTWQTILAASHSISIQRGGKVEGVRDVIDVGTMTVVTLDPELDPAKNSRMRPGRTIRCRADAGGGSWQNLFTGKLNTLDTDYDVDRTTGERTTRVTLVATDAIADLARGLQPAAKSGTYKQRVNAILGSLVPAPAYSVTDTAADITSATIASLESATPLDQLELARDSLQGIFYVDGAGVIQAVAKASIPAVTPGMDLTFTDVAGDGSLHYSAIDAAFGSRGLVNQLTVLKHLATLVDGEKVYGPYVNQASVNSWGPIADQVEVLDVQPSVIAAAYLAMYANPAIFVASVTVPMPANVLASDDLLVRNYILEAELYAGAAITLSDVVTDQLARVIGLEHIITPDKWLTTFRFRPVEASTTVTVTNPAAGADTGPSDLVTVPHGMTGRRHLGAATVNVASGTNSTRQVLNLNSATYPGTITWTASPDFRFTITEPGQYVIVAVCQWSGNATGKRGLVILKNAADMASSLQQSPGNVSFSQHVADVEQLDAGDTISLAVWQNSGATLTVSGGTVDNTMLALVKVAD